jgi:predicted nucleic acid-binding protein
VLSESWKSSVGSEGGSGRTPSHFLDPGERAALILAQLLNADELLIDDHAGRSEGERRNLHVTGTRGVLADGHLAGLIDFDRALVLLRSTNFRLSAEVERLVRRRIAAERNTS